MEKIQFQKRDTNELKKCDTQVYKVNVVRSPIMSKKYMTQYHKIKKWFRGIDDVEYDNTREHQMYDLNHIEAWSSHTHTAIDIHDGYYSSLEHDLHEATTNVIYYRAQLEQNKNEMRKTQERERQNIKACSDCLDIASDQTEHLSQKLEKTTELLSISQTTVKKLSQVESYTLKNQHIFEQQKKELETVHQKLSDILTRIDLLQATD